MKLGRCVGSYVACVKIWRRMTILPFMSICKNSKMQLVDPMFHLFCFQAKVLIKTSKIRRRGPNAEHIIEEKLWSDIPTLFGGFVLHIRGDITPQPLRNRNGDLLLWNGEIFDGFQVNKEIVKVTSVLGLLYIRSK